ncbi:DUF2254 family protein [Candidatus Uabimicrobium sp. HlEnr_7]|uniref:DUF2254 family protein n=1 Tax=Candidatus Uabimicrobium helgolandensis TaxID=3095367 RepID=UPI003555D12C
MFRDQELSKFLRSTLWVTVGLFFVVICFYVVNSFFLLGKVTWQLHFIANDIDIQNVRNAFSSASRVATLLLAMLISGMAIAVPLAANNFTPRLIKMFREDVTNHFIFGLLLCFGTLTMWLCFVVDEKSNLKFYLYSCFILFVVSLSSIVPYLSHLFSFLNPNSLIFRLRISAQHKIIQALRTKNSQKQLIHLKHQVVESMDSLANIALKALERNDRQSFTAAMRNIQLLAIHYCKLKPYLSKKWHYLDTMEIGMFMGILPLARNEIQKQKVTLELHICQFLLEFFECVEVRTRDAADSVSFTIYKIASQYIYTQDRHAIEMYSSLFNSALRLGINNSNIRMVYNIASHYRNLAVDTMSAMPEVTLKITQKMFYYSKLAYQRKGSLVFVVEVMSYEIRKTIEMVVEKENSSYKNIEKMIHILLEIPCVSQQDAPLLGVLKSRLSLSAVLHRYPEYKSYIATLNEPLANVDIEVLEIIYDHLLENNPLLYWEITPRQVNLDYVKIEDRNYIYDTITKIKEKKLQELSSTEE